MDELRYNEMHKGKVTYNPYAIKEARRKSQTDKAHFRKKHSFKEITTKVAVVGIAVVVTAGALMFNDWRGNKDKIKMARKEVYLDNILTIMDKYPESELQSIADETLAILKTENGSEEDISNIEASLKKIAELKAKGMTQETNWHWATILAVASRNGVYLSGYDFTVPTFGDYAEDKIEGMFK
ncbi:MAG TPA: hypothetical protein PLX66_02795 [Bacilli bacterium]|nr:hypothetical protein [Bacilli bacterium]